MQMARVLALTQLLIVGSGGPALFLLVKIEHKTMEPEGLARLTQFLAAHVFAVSILHAAIGAALNGKIAERLICITGLQSVQSFCWCWERSSFSICSEQRKKGRSAGKEYAEARL